MLLKNQELRWGNGREKSHREKKQNYFLEKTVLASSFSEFNSLVKYRFIPDYRIILYKNGTLDKTQACPFANKGKIVFIDIDKYVDLQDIQKSYLHQTSHIYSNENTHNFIFSVIYNLFLMRGGFMPSLDLKDYKNCEFPPLEKEDVRLFSIKFAQILRDTEIPNIIEERLVLDKIENFFDKRMDIDCLNENFSRFVNMISTIKKLFKY